MQAKFVKIRITKVLFWKNLSVVVNAALSAFFERILRSIARVGLSSVCLLRDNGPLCSTLDLKASVFELFLNVAFSWIDFLETVRKTSLFLDGESIILTILHVISALIFSAVICYQIRLHELRIELL